MRSASRLTLCAHRQSVGMVRHATGVGQRMPALWGRTGISGYCIAQHRYFTQTGVARLGGFQRVVHPQQDGEDDASRPAIKGAVLSHTTVLATTAGLTWVDIEGIPPPIGAVGVGSSNSAKSRGGAAGTTTTGRSDGRTSTSGTPNEHHHSTHHHHLTDAEFIVAMRRTLDAYGVPETLVKEVSRVVLLPLTVVAQRAEDVGGSMDEDGLGGRRHSRKDVCLVCRYARVEADEATRRRTMVERAGREGEHTPAQKMYGKSFWKVLYGPRRAMADEVRRGYLPTLKRTQPAAGVGDIGSGGRALGASMKAAVQGWGRFLRATATPTIIHTPAVSQHATGAAGDAVVFESIQHLSYRLSVFIIPSQNMVVTVHRYPINSVSQLKRDWERRMHKVTMDGLLRKLVIDCAQSFLDMERVRAAEVDALEERLFTNAPATASAWGRIKYALLTKPRDDFKESLEQLYGCSREASAYCRVLQPLLRAYDEARMAYQGNTKNIDLVQHRIAAAVSMCEGLREQTQSLLSLQFNVGASKLEELFRLLTIFSTIFIPLEFVASLGGADLQVTKMVLENNDYNMEMSAAIFGGVLLVTLVWVKRMLF